MEYKNVFCVNGPYGSHTATQSLDLFVKQNCGPLSFPSATCDHMLNERPLTPVACPSN